MSPPAAGRRPLVLIAGGGTGGHVYPGLAIADALRGLADVEVAFAGTAKGIEARVIPSRGYRLELFDVAPMKGGGAKRALIGALIAGRATVRSCLVLRRLSPALVISIGGYAAGPVSLAALAMRIPVAIVEPNSVVGLANRILAPLARRAYVAWDETARKVGLRKARVFGVPLRDGFTPASSKAQTGHRVLVLGGSQGASALNERVPEAMGLVAAELAGLEIVHQCGKEREASVTQAYARAGLSRASVVSFIEDVQAELARADLVIARSGASTVAEVSAVGRASILVPFPEAADDHQTKNAQALERTGGAVCLPQRDAHAKRIAAEAARILNDRALRERMEGAARRAGRPDAAARIARDVLSLVSLGVNEAPRSKSSKVNGPSHGAEAR